MIAPNSGTEFLFCNSGFRIILAYPSVSVRVASMMQHHEESKLGRKGFIQLTTPLFSVSKDTSSNRAGTWSQQLMLRPRRSATYWLRLFSYRTQDCQPRDGSTQWTGLLDRVPAARKLLLLYFVNLASPAFVRSSRSSFCRPFLRALFPTICEYP